MRVFLPDPDDDGTVQQLSRRFELDRAKIVESIKESKEYFEALNRDYPGKVQVYYRGGEYLYTCYRFDGEAVIVFYSHQRERVPVVHI